MPEKIKKCLCHIAVLILAVSMTFGKRFLFFTVVAFVVNWLIISRRQIRLDIGDALLFSSMYIFKWIHEDSVGDAFLYALELVAVYQIGKLLAADFITEYGNGEQGDTGSLIFPVMIVSFVMFVRGVLNYSYLWFYPSAVYAEEWPFWGDWGGDPVPRTQHEFFLVMMGSLLLIFVWLLFKKSKTAGIIGVLSSYAAVAFGISSKGRMTFFCAVGSLVLVLLLFVLEKKIYKHRIFLIATGIIVAAIAVFYILVKLDMFGLGQKYMDSMWSGSGGIVHNVRFSLMKQSFELLKDYPFGKCDVPLVENDWTVTPYAHNSWLDIGRRGGIIPFVLATLFSVTNIASLVYAWIKKKDIGIYALIASFTGVTLYNMFEAGIMAGYMIWNTEVLLGGLACGVYRYLSGRKGLVIQLRERG